MTLGAIGPIVMPAATAVAGAAGPGMDGSGIDAAAGGFASQLSKGLEHVQQLQSTADDLAVQAATGDLTDVHDYMIASTEAALATELTVAIRNKAVDAFNEIMRMQA
jgi:flagellar hook-basal body complex protein FliE